MYMSGIDAAVKFLELEDEQGGPHPQSAGGRTYCPVSLSADVREMR